MHKDKESQGQIKSYLFIVYAAVLWASSGTASKYLFNGGMSPYVLGMGGVQIAYLFAISKINVAIAILLEYLAPFFVAIYSSLFFNETMDRWKVFA
jgi:drug/metabolite transporter (DMT)-like permease